MNRTNKLRKTVKTMLSTVCDKVYYLTAPDDAMYPHIVFFMDSVDLGNINRGDYTLQVDVWTKNVATAEDYADAVEDLFNAVNNPQTDNLPTFFIESRLTVIDEDKDIQHKQIRATIQNYERK